MSRRRSGERVLGPYRERKRWKVLLAAPDGSREASYFPSEALARAFADALRAEILVEDLTVHQALERYETHLERKGNTRNARARTRWGVTRFFPDNLPLATLSERKCSELYRAMTERFAVDSHRNALAEVKTFLRWCVAQRWIPKSPAEGVQGIGRRRTGKAQLRLDEARAWYDRALYLAHRGEPGAVAALLCLLLSLRSSAVVALRVRDVDDGGALLWIEQDKTSAGRRRLDVPSALRPLLLAQAAGKRPDELLLGQHWRDWPRRWSRRICREVGVPEISAHGLRGTHATLATEAGATGLLVAATLGHESPSITEAAYTSPEASRKAKTGRVLHAIAGGKRR